MLRGSFAALLVIAVTAAVFSRTVNYPFLNWDDQEVFVCNDALRSSGMAGWAFTTRHMEHYQPLAWMTWGGIERTFGLTPASAHALNITLHSACALLVLLLARRLTKLTAVTAVAVALVFAIHPLRVEPVVWASAMPYSLALVLALLATLAWQAKCVWLAAICFALSLLSRPIAVALPLVLWVVRRPTDNREWPALIVTAASAAAAVVLESSARLTTTLAEFGVGPRITLAATAPWRYLGRTIWPSALTPLDPLALTPRTDAPAIVLGIAGILLVSLAAWQWRREHPVLAGAWIAYLALLAPAMGFLPSGLQATADRYTYFPAVPISIGIAYMIAKAEAFALRRRTRRAMARSAMALAIAAMTILTAATWRQTGYWRDSISLWMRAVDVDPANDVALYNLGAALADAGRRDEAIARYEQLLAIVPAHAEARRNRDLLMAQRLEDEANHLAAQRDLAAAVDRYAAAVKLDPRRTHSQAALGMALIELGRLHEARPHLQTALDQNDPDPAVANALAYVLVQSGDDDAAVTVLREAQRRHPTDANIARNLAMVEKKKGGR